MTQLDDLKIRRAPGRVSRMPWKIINVAVVFVLLAGGTAYLFWPAPGIAVRIATAEAVSGRGGGGLDATGYVVARRQATLSAKILGKLVEVNVEEGQKVASGQIVARLDDSNYAAALRQAQAQAAQARASFADAVPIFERYRRLRAQNAISTDAFENQRLAYDTARTQRDVADAAVTLARSYENDTVIRAPYAGVVTDKAAQIGEIVAPAAAGGGFTRTGIATIVDMDSLEVEVDVSENYIDRVHAGGDTSVRLDAYPDWGIPASVIAVIPTADQSKGTVKVRIAIHAKDSRILPQMGARVAFVGEQVPREIGVAIPAAAILRREGKQAVLVIGDNNRVHLRFVKAGPARKEAVLVSVGLAPGERVVLGDVERLRDGSNVKVEP
jgi:RND family efflux transporter MFP subunit